MPTANTIISNVQELKIINYGLRLKNKSPRHCVSDFGNYQDRKMETSNTYGSNKLFWGFNIIFYKHIVQE